MRKPLFTITPRDANAIAAGKKPHISRREVFAYWQSLGSKPPSPLLSGGARLYDAMVAILTHHKTHGTGPYMPQRMTAAERSVLNMQRTIERGARARAGEPLEVRGGLTKRDQLAEWIEGGRQPDSEPAWHVEHRRREVDRQRDLRARKKLLRDAECASAREVQRPPVERRRGLGPVRRARVLYLWGVMNELVPCVPASEVQARSTWRDRRMSWDD
jgi:hypothetical protein